MLNKFAKSFGSLVMFAAMVFFAFTFTAFFFWLLFIVLLCFGFVWMFGVRMRISINGEEIGYIRWFKFYPTVVPTTTEL